MVYVSLSQDLGSGYMKTGAVAVLVGYFLGGEALGLRTILGTPFVLISVVVITTTRVKKTVATLAVEDTG